MLRRTVSMNEFESMTNMLYMLRTLGLDIEYVITWEQKPKIIINRFGDFEFEKPEETYGCIITFMDMELCKNLYKVRFAIAED